MINPTTIDLLERHAPYSGLYQPTIYVVSLSSGVPSAVCAQRVIDRYGRANVQLVFADTTIEDESNYEFLLNLEHHWQMQVHYLADGRTPFEVAEDEHVIPTQFLAPCTKRLKLEVIRRHVLQLQKEGYRVVMCIGMDTKDKRKGRLDSPVKNWGELGVRVEYPLLWTPIEYNAQTTLKSWGIAAPRMYAQGFSHANCGGRCVKQGKRDWRRTLRYFPERFAEVEAWEKRMRLNPTNAGYTLLREIVGGERSTYTLEQLRLETEAANERQLRLFDFLDDGEKECGVECGVA